MNKTIKRDDMLNHLKDYRKYLRRLLNEQDGADASVHEFNGAIRAVNSLIFEIRKGKV